MNSTRTTNRLHVRWVHLALSAWLGAALFVVGCDEGTAIAVQPNLEGFDARGLDSQEAHLVDAADNLAAGALLLVGTVIDHTTGTTFLHEPFEVILRPADAAAGSAPHRILCGDGSGRFEVCPPPGRYTLEVRTANNRVTEQTTIDVPVPMEGGEYQLTLTLP